MLRPSNRIIRCRFGLVPCDVRVQSVRSGSIRFGSNSNVLFYFILSIDIILANRFDSNSNNLISGFTSNMCRSFDSSNRIGSALTIYDTGTGMARSL